MRILVLGAYGLIGAEIVRALQEAGHDVTGFVRSGALAARLIPQTPCIKGDIAKCQTSADWSAVKGFEAVVNASGALQTSLKDNVSAVQEGAVKALISACEQSGVRRFVQISAPGAVEEATTEFMRSKARADAFLRASNLDWVIFKPGLVISRTAYGGTALIRMLAGFPFFLPVALPAVRIQTVSASEVGEAVALALDSKVPMWTDYDLVEQHAHSLEELIARFRKWMGFRSAPVLRVPYVIGVFGAFLGDCAGWLGWRAPLRTTALKVLEKDVLGDGEAWRNASGRPVAPLSETLADMPATLQERVFARTQLVAPALILLLSMFFMVSGVIGFTRLNHAAGMLTNAVPDNLARLLATAGAALDILLGGAILVRAFAKPAAIGMILLSAAYLVLGTALTPALWLDPLGPLVKIFPVIGLSLCVLAMVEER